MHHVRLASFYGPEEAYCARGFLAANGFDVVIFNEEHLNMNAALRIALGGYTLAVPEACLPSARALLDEIAATPPLAIEEEETCPVCGSRDLVRLKNWLWLPLIVMFGIPFIPPRRRVKCRSCGHISDG